jgi:hypothetical protein
MVNVPQGMRLVPATSAPKTRNKSGKEDGPATVAGEERFGMPQALWRDENVSSPPHHEWATSEAAYPVAYLAADHSTEDAEEQRVSKVQYSPMN